MSDRTDALKAADSGAWPPASDEAAWDHLREWAFQWACLLADIDESKAWVNAMATLAGQDLPHDEYTVTRLRMLSDRIRGRKLAQSALRWKFGFKTGRSEALIRRDIRAFHKAHRAQLH